MQRKLFVAINLDDKTKKHIAGKIKRITDKIELPLKYTGADNYHITLSFIGYVDDTTLDKLVKNLKQALSGTEIFDIHFYKIGWGPKEEKPKMLWVKGKKDDQLSFLRAKVESGLSGMKLDKKNFSPHITLGRILQAEVGSNNKLPAINEPVNVLVPVKSVEVMESVVEKGKRKYYVMESIDLD